MMATFSRRRGVASMALVLGAVFIIAGIQAAGLKARSHRAAAVADALAAERARFAEEDVSRSFKEVLLLSRGATLKERALNTARNLAGWEAFVEGRYADDGMAVDVWLGSPSEAELGELAATGVSPAGLRKCVSCLDFSSAINVAGGGQLPAGVLVSVPSPGNSTTAVSRNSLVFNSTFRHVGAGCSIAMGRVARARLFGAG